MDDDDDDEFRFNDTSRHEDHFHQNDVLTWFGMVRVIMISHICRKFKTRTNLKIKNFIFC